MGATHVDEPYHCLPPPPPFDECDPDPVWPGMPWGEGDQVRHANGRPTAADAAEAFYEVVPGAKHARIPLVRFSRKHPGLLDARASNRHAGVATAWGNFRYNESLSIGISLYRNIPLDH